MGLARSQRGYGSGNLRIWLADFPNEYKAIFINTDSELVLHICVVNHWGNKHYSAEMYVQPFGSRMGHRELGKSCRVFTILRAGISASTSRGSRRRRLLRRTAPVCGKRILGVRETCANSRFPYIEPEGGESPLQRWGYSGGIFIVRFLY